jgi:phosphoribosylformimino-5-aminoimidazole carboxamide ribotide isomerase
MQIIPVLDVAQGQVVRAVRGQRSAYRPMRSQLAAGSDPVDLAHALRAHPAVVAAPTAQAVMTRSPAHAVLYAADLDALGGGAPQAACWARLLAAWPQMQLWLDAGFEDGAQGQALRRQLGTLGERLRPVHGSESLRSRAALAAIAQDPQAILSLDCRGGQALDPAACWQAPSLWPRTVIVMTLDRVGAAAGPDLDTLAQLRARAPDPGRRWIGAGGVRVQADVERAAAAGAQAWLVASALHDGTL